MANTQNVLVGVPVGGGVYMTPAPVDAAEYPTTTIGTALTTPYVAAGFISEDGVTESNESDTEKIKAWGGDTVRVVQSDHTVTYSFTFLESKSEDVLKAVYGEDNVTAAGDVTTVNVNSSILEHRSWVFEMKDGDHRIRIFVPDGQIINRGEVNYTHAGVISYEVTIEAFPDADGNKAIKVIDSSVPVTP